MLQHVNGQISPSTTASTPFSSKGRTVQIRPISTGWAIHDGRHTIGVLAQFEDWYGLALHSPPTIDSGEDWTELLHRNL